MDYNHSYGWINGAAGNTQRSGRRDREKMFVWGGQLGADTFSGTGSLYEPASDSWLPITTVGAPSARRGHTMVLDGSKEALIWGGFSGIGYTNSGARFDVELGSWMPISLTGAPAEREGTFCSLDKFGHGDLGWAKTVLVRSGMARFTTGAPTNGARFRPRMRLRHDSALQWSSPEIES